MGHGCACSQLGFCWNRSPISSLFSLPSSELNTVGSEGRFEADVLGELKEEEEDPEAVVDVDAGRRPLVVVVFSLDRLMIT